MAKVTLSNKQAHAFALAIYKDIKAYCEAHKAEFEAFLKEEQKKELNSITSHPTESEETEQ